MTIIVKGESIPEEEKQAYVDYVTTKYKGRIISSLCIEVDGDEVNLQTTFSDQPFERIRRITGYLVGTLDRFNNGKRAEEHDRVKHTVQLKEELK